jgi:DNA-binding transcriptional LysR family regulator
LAIKQFEEQLGVRLLHRTTRHVNPTLEGATTGDVRRSWRRSRMPKLL